MTKHRARAVRNLPPLLSLGDPTEMRRVNCSAMRSERVDIDDIRPDAKTGKTITGWRTSCPLRRALGIKWSSITREHVLAADRLRQLCDACVIGYSGKRDMTPAQA